MTIRCSHSPRIACLASILAMMLLVLVGCTRKAEPAADASAHPQRIVTLSPALTQMLVDLHVADRLVGVAEHDAAAPAGLPIVGNFVDVQAEALLSVRPTHVLTMSAKEQPPARLRELAAAGHFELVVYPYPVTINDTMDILAPSDTEASAGPPTIGEVVGKSDEARTLRARVLGRLEALRELTADRDAPSVLIVIGSNPIMASGPGTVHDELLGFVGGVNAARNARVTAPTYDREALLVMSPQVILLLRPGSAPLVANDRRLADLPLTLPAMQNDRVGILNGPLVMLPSSSLDGVAADMARLIHPDLSESIDALAGSQEPSP